MYFTAKVFAKFLLSEFRNRDCPQDDCELAWDRQYRCVLDLNLCFTVQR